MKSLVFILALAAPNITYAPDIYWNNRSEVIPSPPNPLPNNWKLTTGTAVYDLGVTTPKIFTIGGDLATVDAAGHKKCLKRLSSAEAIKDLHEYAGLYLALCNPPEDHLD